MGLLMRDFQKDKFKFLEEIGKGGFAKVYRAQYIGSNQYYALKVMSRHWLEKKKLASKVENEIKIQSKLSHPNILKLIAHFKNSEMIFIVLELCEEGNLFQYLKKNPSLSQRTKLSFFHQTVKSVDYLHSLNIIHRDLKLSNILLTKSLVIKLSDFGLAVEIQLEEEQHTICGTEKYMAPEVSSKAGSYNGKKVDIWALGCLFYALIFVDSIEKFAGKEQENMLALVKKVQLKTALSRKGCILFIFLSLDSLLLNLLNGHPAKRPETKQILDHEIFYEEVVEITEAICFIETSGVIGIKQDVGSHSLFIDHNGFVHFDVNKLCPGKQQSCFVFQKDSFVVNEKCIKFSNAGKITKFHYTVWKLTKDAIKLLKSMCPDVVLIQNKLISAFFAKYGVIKLWYKNNEYIYDLHKGVILMIKNPLIWFNFLTRRGKLVLTEDSSIQIQKSVKALLAVHSKLLALKWKGEIVHFPYVLHDEFGSIKQASIGIYLCFLKLGGECSVSLDKESGEALFTFDDGVSLVLNRLGTKITLRDAENNNGIIYSLLPQQETPSIPNDVKGRIRQAKQVLQEVER
eukprot:maker-scaffold_15-snap-gene-2.19-mRNA-1 protein AED:0.04 eAED:0.12 QI:0/0.75/0.2/1/0.75/0.6/5/125/571